MSHYDQVAYTGIEQVKSQLSANTDRCKCGSCGEQLDASALRGYPSYTHSDGIMVDGKKYWLYLRCDNCGYDTALWKLRIVGLQ